MSIISNCIKYKSDYVIIEYKENEISKRAWESINELINRDSNTTVPLFRLKKMTCFSACFTVLPVTLWNSLDFNCKQIWFGCSELWNINIYKIIINMVDTSQLKSHPVVHLTDEGVKLFGTLPCRTFAIRGAMLAGITVYIRSFKKISSLNSLCCYIWIYFWAYYK